MHKEWGQEKTKCTKVHEKGRLLVLKVLVWPNKLDTFKLYVPFRKGLPPNSHLRTLTTIGGILRREGDPKIQLNREETTHNILIH